MRSPVARPLAKAITARNISDRIVYLLAKSQVAEESQLEYAIKGLEPTRLRIAEFVAKELDAYDQRA